MSDSLKRFPEAYDAVVEHLRSEGGKNWKVVRDRFPEVPEATFWRYVRQARQDRADGQALADARQRIADHVAAKSEPGAGKSTTTSEIDPGLVPSIALGFRRLDLLGQLDSLFADIELLREYAMSDDGQIRNPHYFAQSTSMRDRALNSALRIAESVWNLQSMLEFYDLVVGVIASTDPATAHKIMDHLKRLVPGGDQEPKEVTPRPREQRAS